MLKNKFCITKKDPDFFPYVVMFSSMLAPLLVELIAVLTHGLGRIFTIFIYLIAFIEFSLFLRKRVDTKCLVYIAFLHLFIFLNYLIFPDNREYIYSTSMLIIYFLYWPIGIVVSNLVKEWDNFHLYMKPFSIIAVLIGSYIVFFADVKMYSEYFSYMEFSYAILPFVASLYINFRSNFQIITLVACLIGSIELLIYGARFAVFSYVVFVVLFEIFNNNKSNYKKILSLSILGLISLLIIINFENILISLSNTELFTNSRIIQKLLSNDITSSIGRDNLYNKSLLYINHMGLNFLGIFGDRNILDIWPHNFAYEILMQFGWIIGCFIFIILFVLIIKSLLFSYNKNLCVFLLCVFLLKLSVSCSYLQEYGFWYSIFIMYRITKRRISCK